MSRPDVAGDERTSAGENPREDESALIAALQAGDEAAFRTVFDQFDPTLRRLARSYARADAVAEEIVQETWLGVVRGIGRFEGRSSLKTWIFRILVNVARTRAGREARTIPFSSAAPPSEDSGPVDADRFFGADHDRWPGHWCQGPAAWGVPDERALAKEMREEILAAIDSLSGSQREVITLRDIGGWDSREVCNALGVSEVNQRVLLHRARARVRAAVEESLGAIEQTT
ncbi:MAG: sigma-70 family RNA polymerase sigma factor [Solirubrobacterales bacterium]|nr:MAG: sigma-70 family RNA polymerase sigma factor [Solirubrobacterales bacterium]